MAQATPLAPGVAPTRLGRRIIGCEGTAQLVTACAVLAYRRAAADRPDQRFEDYLVIHGLGVPVEQAERFAASIRAMAETLWRWKGIVYLTRQQVQSLTKGRLFLPPGTVRRRLHGLIGIDHVEEIYLGRNWQHGNPLLLDAYRAALKVCYGDGVGLYLPPNTGALMPGDVIGVRGRVSAIRRKIKALVARWALPLHAFDVGYLFCPGVLGDIPPMPVVRPAKVYLRTALGQLRGFVDEASVSRVRLAVAGAPVCVLLTSNLSEAGRMSRESELAAYREFVGRDKRPGATLVIKPHPRDDPAKTVALGQTLAGDFRSVVLLSGAEAQFLPFELFFMAALDGLSGARNVTVYAVSAACLSLKLLFGVASVVGFGESTTRRLFRPEFVEGRVRHECDLQRALSAIDS